MRLEDIIHHFLSSGVYYAAHLKIYTNYLSVGKMAGNRVKETNTSQFFGKRSLWTGPA